MTAEKIKNVTKNVSPKQTHSGQLEHKVAIVTDGEDGIGREISLALAKEGADIGLIYKSEVERKGAEEAREAVRALGRGAILLEGDVADQTFCAEAVQKVADTFGSLDILVNNTEGNVFLLFNMIQAAVPLLGEDATIVNTSSLEMFTRMLSEALLEKKIRINSIAPGPLSVPAYVFLAGPDSARITGQTIIIH